MTFDQKGKGWRKSNEGDHSFYVVSVPKMHEIVKLNLDKAKCEVLLSLISSFKFPICLGSF